MLNTTDRYGFIGAGNMGGALAQAVARVVGGERVLVADRTEELTATAAMRWGVTASDRETVINTCRVVFLGVKPAQVAAVLEDIYPFLVRRTDPVLLVSMAAGVKIELLENHMARRKLPLIRMMPNTPVTVGEGVVVYTASSLATEEDAELFCDLMSATGRVLPLTEPQLEAAGALSGCGPAFVYLFMEALADGGVECGLARKDALLLAEQTVLGAARMARDSGHHPGELKDAVCSPGGTTIAGVHALEKAGFRGAAMEAVTTAFAKTEQLAKK